MNNTCALYFRVVKPLDPELRPKGMGLGANKVINLKMKTGGVDNDGNELILVKGAYAKIIAGKNSGDYCEVLLTYKWDGIVCINNIYFRFLVLMKNLEE